MSGVKTYLRFILATLVAVSCTAPAVAAGRAKPEKVDKALAGALTSGAGTHKVIITLQPGQRSSVRKSLEAKGRRIRREHSSLNLLVADLSTADVMEWVKSKKVKALSLDGPVRVSQAPDPSVTVSQTTAAPGSAITVTVSNPTAHLADWVALSVVGSPNFTYVAWKYLNGSTTLPIAALPVATLQLVAPPTAGIYEVRLLSMGGFSRLATSSPVLVAVPTPTVDVASTSVSPGSVITVNVGNGPGHPSDWVALAMAGAPNTSYVAWKYLNGSTTVPASGLTTATLNMTAPMTGGTYEARLFAHNGFTRLGATTVTVEVPQAVTTVRRTLGLPQFANTTGFSSIGVAIIDSGIAPSADFAGRITGFYDFTNGRNGASVAPYDSYGHGTHVAGLVGSSGILSNYEVQGIAPGVRLIGLKVLDGTGAGNTSDVIAALQFVTANKTQLNVHIVNMSLGHPIYAPAELDPLVQAVQQATAAGLIVVTSSGNYGRNQTTLEPGTPELHHPATRRLRFAWDRRTR